MSAPATSGSAARRNASVACSSAPISASVLRLRPSPGVFCGIPRVQSILPLVWLCTFVTSCLVERGAQLASPKSTPLAVPRKMESLHFPFALWQHSAYHQLQGEMQLLFY